MRNDPPSLFDGSLWFVYLGLVGGGLEMIMVHGVGYPWIGIIEEPWDYPHLEVKVGMSLAYGNMPNPICNRILRCVIAAYNYFGRYLTLCAYVGKGNRTET